LWVSERQPTSLVVSQVDDGVVYASSDTYWGNATPDPPDFSMAYAFPATCQRGCEPIWTAPLMTSDATVVPVTASSGTVYVARPARDGRWTLSADAATCGLATRCRSWSAPLPASPSGPPIVVDDMVVVSIPGADTVRAYPATCSGRCDPLWSVAVPGLSDVRPAAAVDLLFVGSTSGVVAVPLDCGTAGCLPLQVTDREARQIAVADGEVFIRSSNGRVTALAPVQTDEEPPSAVDRRSSAILSIGLILAAAVGFVLFARSRRESLRSM
jgi:hypothetical protein